MEIKIKPSEPVLSFPQSLVVIVVLAMIVATIFMASERLARRHNLVGTVRILPIVLSGAAAILTLGVTAMIMTTKDSQNGDWSKLETSIAQYAPAKDAAAYARAAQRLEPKQFLESKTYNFALLRNSRESFTLTVRDPTAQLIPLARRKEETHGVPRPQGWFRDR